MDGFKANFSFIYCRVMIEMKTGVLALNHQKNKVDSEYVNKIMANEGFFFLAFYGDF